MLYIFINTIGILLDCCKARVIEYTYTQITFMRVNVCMLTRGKIYIHVKYIYMEITFTWKLHLHEARVDKKHIVLMNYL